MSAASGLRSGPFWLDAPELRDRSIDQLGVRQPGLTLAARFLPGLTNTTRVARYYSVIAWLAVNAKSAAHCRSLETAFIQAVRVHHAGVAPVRGLVGIEKAPRQGNGRWPLKSAEPLPSALDAAFYGPSVKALNLANFDAKSPEYTDFADELAKALGVDDSAVPPPDLDNISAARAAKLAPLCPCTPPSGQERDLLIELLFRLDRPRAEGSPAAAEDARRRRGLALLIDACDGTTDEEVALPQLFLDWAVGRGTYAPPAALGRTALIGAVVGLRHHFRFALETAWYSFWELLEPPRLGLSVKPFVDRVLKEADGADRWRPSKTTLVSEAVTRFRSERNLEATCKQRLRDELDPAAALLAAAVTLAVLLRSARSLEERWGEDASRHLRTGEPTTVPITTVAAELTQDVRIADWVHLLIERYVVAQHYYTASRKWAEGSDAFFFHSTERGYRQTGKTNWFVDGGRTRVPAALSLLAGLSLVAYKGTTLKPVTAGRSLVQRVLRLE